MRHYIEATMNGDPALWSGRIVPGLVQVVHHQRHHGHDIALAFPDMELGKALERDGVEQPRKIGHRVRFWAEPATLEDLAGALDNHLARVGISGESVTINMDLEVPETITEWVAYTRFRIPSRQRNRNENPGYRENRMRKRADMLARQRLIPFLDMESSKGQRFGLGIEPVYASEPPQTQGQLNGYGISTKATPYWLPSF
ncbi:type I-F CRISPR-associated endoribonuclease Cas6/Csy4 [Halomonadaceae bacterium KBTZ08]